MNTTHAKAAFIGGAAGIMAGLFGVGGGIIVVPGLVLWLAVNQRQASGTSIATIVASSSAALVAFGISGSVDWGAALLVFTGAAVGAVIGARAATLLGERTLSAAFAVVLLIAGIRMML
ncbi:MAG: sulfite exporter TauE/SafE family protein [Acidobacteria bacterium]|nr:sulfite exporter TauE/SafE family protein [Acidobacteriota bacterium]